MSPASDIPTDGLPLLDGDPLPSDSESDMFSCYLKTLLNV